jgi:hypothetical protein
MIYARNEMLRPRTSGYAELAAIAIASVLWIVARPARAQSSEPGGAVSLGSVSGTPKGEVMVPVLLTPRPSETEIGSVELEITFESEAVSFLLAEKSFLLDGVRGVLEARQTVDPADAAKSRVFVRIETKSQPRKSLPEGLILSLRFAVKPSAIPGTTVPLKVGRLSLEDLSSPPKSVRAGVDSEGSIEVIRPEDVPVVPCFFFAH